MRRPWPSISASSRSLGCLNVTWPSSTLPAASLAASVTVLPEASTGAGTPSSGSILKVYLPSMSACVRPSPAWPNASVLVPARSTVASLVP